MTNSAPSWEFKQNLIRSENTGPKRSVFFLHSGKKSPVFRFANLKTAQSECKVLETERLVTCQNLLRNILEKQQNY